MRSPGGLKGPGVRGGDLEGPPTRRGSWSLFPCNMSWIRPVTAWPSELSGTPWPLQTIPRGRGQESEPPSGPGALDLNSSPTSYGPGKGTQGPEKNPKGTLNHSGRVLSRQAISVPA